MVHRGDRHVTEPTDLSEEEAAGFWREVLLVSRAVEQVYSPLKMNLMMLGNQVPHLHTHIVPRYRDDADAGGPSACRKTHERELRQAGAYHLSSGSTGYA